MPFYVLQFSSIGSKAPTQGISPYTGQWEDIDTNMRWLPKTYALFVISFALLSLLIVCLWQHAIHRNTHYATFLILFS